MTVTQAPITTDPTPALDRGHRRNDRRAKCTIAVLVVLILAVLGLIAGLLLTPADPAPAPDPMPEPVKVAPTPVVIANPYSGVGEYAALATDTPFVAPVFANDALPDGDLSVTLDVPGKVATVKGWAVHDETGKYLKTVPADVDTVTRHYRLILEPTNKDGQEYIAYRACPVGFDDYCIEAAIGFHYQSPTY